MEETNKQGRKRTSTNEQTSRLLVRKGYPRMDGLMKWWKEAWYQQPENQPQSHGWEQAKPRSASPARVSLLQTPPLISTQLAWSSICCLECHTNTLTHTHTHADWIQHKNTTTLPHRRRGTLTRTYTQKHVHSASITHNNCSVTR